MRGPAEDVRYAFRRIRREPGFFVFAALIIGLGVGANTAVYSVVSPLMLRPLPFDEPDRLVWIANAAEGGMSAVTSRTSNLRDFRERNRSFDAITGYFAFFDYESYNLVGDGQPERLVGVGVAQDFLDVLGVPLLMGRNFVDEEGVWGGRPAAILTHGFWTRRFDADRAIIGRSITLNGEPTTIIGVLPAWFNFASTFAPASRVDFLRPFPISDETDAWGNTLAMIGRLRPGVTVESAQADLDAVIARLKEENPARWGLNGAVTGLREQIAGDFRTALLLLVAAAGAVLLVACANLSNLLLARGQRRGKELAVRSALGADRLRLLRQLSIESLVLAACGGLVGVLIAVGATRLVTATSAIRIPLLDTIAVDGSALLFTLVVTLAAGFLLGIAPVLMLTSGREAATIHDASRGSTESRRSAAVREVLVVAEVALACILLVGVGLLLRSFAGLLDVQLGFQPAGVMTWRVDTDRNFENRVAAVAFYDQVIASVAAVPGVEGAGLTDTPPLGRNRGWGIRARGVVYAEGQMPSAFPRMVDSGYLDVMRVPLRAGRYFTPQDGPRSDNVIILNETAARTLFPGEDPIGRLVITAGGEDRQVVGVVADVRHRSLEQESGLEMYMPITQSPDFLGLTMVVRSQRPAASLVTDIRAALSDVDAAMPTGDYQSFDAIVDRSVSPRRFILIILGTFAGAALLLAGLGIYAVLSYGVSQRIPEIGIRMALGESAAQVRRRVVGRTMLLAGTGVLIGAISSLVLARLIRSLLFGIEPTDALTFIAMAAILLAVSAFAGYLPARRASSTDPLVALRST